jgi:hypothetical protein
MSLTNQARTAHLVGVLRPRVTLYIRQSDNATYPLIDWGYRLVDPPTFHVVGFPSLLVSTDIRMRSNPIRLDTNVVTYSLRQAFDSFPAWVATQLHYWTLVEQLVPAEARFFAYTFERPDLPEVELDRLYALYQSTFTLEVREEFLKMVEALNPTTAETSRVVWQQVFNLLDDDPMIDLCALGYLRRCTESEYSAGRSVEN